VRALVIVGFVLVVDLIVILGGAIYFVRRRDRARRSTEAERALGRTPP
jgi:hypothetical protein